MEASVTFTPPIRRRNHGRGHSYIDANGIKVPGVTTIINDGVPKPALMNWAANTTAEYAVDRWDDLGEMKPAARLKALKDARYADRDAAANRGTAVHNIAERLGRGEEVPVPEELAGHVESYVKFLDDWDPEILLTESPIVSYRHGYAGTFDLIATLAGERWLLDIKTSRSGVFGETALQLAAYRYADFYIKDGADHPMPEVAHTGVIHVRADGYSLVPVTAEREQFRAFLYVQQVGQFCAASRDLVLDELTPPRLEASA